MTRRAKKLKAAGFACAVLMALEASLPLRRQREPYGRRFLRNASFGVLAALVTAMVEAPLAAALAKRVAHRRQGISFAFSALPGWVSDLVAVLMLDATLYLWHRQSHSRPLLWRYHQIHHADLDLDLSTALRFHVGELLLSVPFRMVQIRLIGVSPRALRIWQKATMASVAFHHSNLRLPSAWDGVLRQVIVTPRLHGIHHSARIADQNSNWSSGLTVWDRVFGTLRTDVPQDSITVGLPLSGAR